MKASVTNNRYQLSNSIRDSHLMTLDLSHHLQTSEWWSVRQQTYKPLINDIRTHFHGTNEVSHGDRQTIRLEVPLNCYEETAYERITPAGRQWFTDMLECLKKHGFTQLVIPLDLDWQNRKRELLGEGEEIPDPMKPSLRVEKPELEFKKVVLEWHGGGITTMVYCPDGCPGHERCPEYYGEKLHYQHGTDYEHSTEELLDYAHRRFPNATVTTKNRSSRKTWGKSDLCDHA